VGSTPHLFNPRRPDYHRLPPFGPAWNCDRACARVVVNRVPILGRRFRRPDAVLEARV